MKENEQASKLRNKKTACNCDPCGIWKMRYLKALWKGNLLPQNPTND
jgi:hypothetical protein